MPTHHHARVFVLLLALLTHAACLSAFDPDEVQLQRIATEGSCQDGRDDDGDGLTDCDDADCAQDPACVVQLSNEDCGNGFDDDSNGFTDCGDPACDGVPPCPVGGGEGNCLDGFDNDGDGLFDCADPDCAGNVNCPDDERRCGDGQDDDRDGLTDCEDTDCADDPDCAERVCDDDADNDGDGLTDCEDTDCAGFLGCQPELCDDGLDNNGDGLTDCADPLCAEVADCQERDQCGDGVDNDLNGDIDCDDAACAQDPICIEEVCDNGQDDDGDGLTDCDDDECFSYPTCIEEICDNGQDDDNDGDADCDDDECVGRSECIAEICGNTLDDDGDGDIDCDDDECVDAFTAEVCDGIDNDCNGQIDEPAAAIECLPLDNAEAVGCTPAGRCDYVCSEGFRDVNEDLSLVGSDGCECAVLTCEQQLGVCAGAELVECPGDPALPEACPRGVYTTHADTSVGVPYQSGIEVRCDGEDNDCDGEADELCCGVLEAALIPDTYSDNATLFATALADPFLVQTAWVASEMEGIPGDLLVHVDDPFDANPPAIIDFITTPATASQVAIAALGGLNSAIALTQFSDEGSQSQLKLALNVNLVTRPVPVRVDPGDGDDYNPILRYRVGAQNGNDHIVLGWTREDFALPSPHTVRIARFANFDHNQAEYYTLDTLNSPAQDLSLSLTAADDAWGGVAAWYGASATNNTVRWAFSSNASTAPNAIAVNAETPHPSVAAYSAGSALLVYSDMNPNTGRLDLVRVRVNNDNTSGEVQRVFASPRDAAFARFATLDYHPEGGLWMIWHEAAEDTNFTDSDLLMVKLSTSGVPLGDPIHVATLAADVNAFTDNASVIVNSTHVIVTYTADLNPNDGQRLQRIHQARFDTEGNPICPE